MVARDIWDVEAGSSSLPTPTKTRQVSSEACRVFLFERDLKDERHRATLRWSVVTASDQAPAGARIEPLRAKKKHFFGSAFLMKFLPYGTSEIASL